MARIIIDPVTRAGGQLRVEADVAGGRVTEAWSSVTMFRGLETVLRGRDPRDAWLLAQRVCGTCTGVHALASVRAVEQALGIAIPTNARLIRNVLAGTLLVRDHVMRLYQEGLPDWVDTAAAITADPIATSRLARAAGSGPNDDADRFRGVLARLEAAVAAGQPGPLASAWAGHPAYRLSPEQSLVLVAHMLEAFDWQSDFMRIHALLGGKDPHPQTYLVGGMALVPPWGGPAASRTRQHPQVPDHNAPPALSEEGIDLMRRLVAGARAFVEQVYVPDVRLLLGAYPEWISTGAGPGSFLSFGEYPLDDGDRATRLLPGGRLMDGNLERAEPVVETAIAESALHAWYTYSNGDASLRRPAEGETEPDFTVQELPLKELDGRGKYTWTKAARYDGRVMETGPLARVLVAAANGQADIRLALGAGLTDLGLESDALTGALARMLARAIEAEVVVRKLDGWLWELRSNLATGDVSVTSVELWDPVSWPSEAEGSSLGEGPRGSVGHWIRIKDKVIDHYQLLDGSTWNASPRDGLGLTGPMEFALAGLDVADPAMPVELLRVVHSFAPCAACAAHIFEPRPGGPCRFHTCAAEGIR